MNRQLLDSQGPIPGMTPAQALTAIQTMAEHSQKWHDGTTSRNIGSSSSNDGLAALVGCQICEGPYLDKDCPLNEEVKQVEEDRYGEFGRTRPFNGVTTLAKEAVTKIDKNEDCKAKDPGSFILPPKEKYPGSFIQLPPEEKDPGRRKILEALSYPAQLEVDYDDNNDFYDPDQCRDGRNNEIRERIIHNLHEEWFKGTSDEEDDIEGIIDYLEPTSYDRFIYLDDEEYNKRRCRLLGMPYIEPLPIIIEQVKITRYSLGPGEVYIKHEVSNMEELPQTRNNVATIRSNIMEDVFENYEDEMM
ncbi:hypothetical protein Tco_1060021 [Tanacetum coccineum]